MKNASRRQSGADAADLGMVEQDGLVHRAGVVIEAARDREVELEVLLRDAERGQVAHDGAQFVEAGIEHLVVGISIGLTRLFYILQEQNMTGDEAQDLVRVFARDAAGVGEQLAHLVRADLVELVDLTQHAFDIRKAHAALGSICSGGRYDNLASQGNKKYPGVGESLACQHVGVGIRVWNEADRSASNLIANQLRSRGIAADVAPTAAKLGKQIKYADKLGIPYVWFPADASEEGAQDEVKNIITGDQRPADAQSWEPDTVYAQQTVTVEA